MASGQKTETPKNPIDIWKKISWNDLNAWAGGKTLIRGRRYQKAGCVKQLVITKAGFLIATVTGGCDHSVFVGFTSMKKKTLVSKCSCQTSSKCKHAVATIVEYLDRHYKGETVPLGSQNDPRLKNAEHTEQDSELSNDWKRSLTADIEEKSTEELNKLLAELLEATMEVQSELRSRSEKKK